MPFSASLSFDCGKNCGEASCSSHQGKFPLLRSFTNLVEAACSRQQDATSKPIRRKHLSDERTPIWIALARRRFPPQRSCHLSGRLSGDPMRHHPRRGAITLSRISIKRVVTVSKEKCSSAHRRDSPGFPHRPSVFRRLNSRSAPANVSGRSSLR